ncbi:hypothetical protein EJ06DRAFT_532029 [Trichodelitschia bisporula]|uniref:Autophagy-related protein 11 n=1 Tax=Trichodelitschia bisporula TaxID=703511 RepID=A0A6G1HQL0_9PEZI|nr:hypothetical protein EJ06DRAFT_532029 [Trichodelitschia bisporula]
MSLQISIVPSGECITCANPVPTSLDALRSWIAKATGIPTHDQILLTLKGKHAKLQTLLTERELYLFPRPLFTPSPSSSSQTNQLAPLTPLPPITAWQNLFAQRRAWAISVLEACRSMSSNAEAVMQKRAVVEKGLRIATLSHDTHVKGLEAKYAEAKAWFEDVRQSVGGFNLQEWEEEMGRLQGVKANAEFGRFFGVDTDESKSLKADGTLATLVEPQSARKAVEESKAVLEGFVARLKELGGALEDVCSHELTRDNPEEPGLASDCDHASKIALLHTRNFLPNIREYSKEMGELGRFVVEQKNALVQRTLEHLQRIAIIESTLAEVHKELNALQIPEEGMAAFDRATLAVRRKEWADKMKKDSASLAEELAGYQEEEHKRRKKWAKGLNDVVLEGLDGRVLGVEINVQGDDYEWPSVSLATLPGQEETVESLQQMLRDLDKPTRQQVKRAKVFKMGSIHEAGFGRGSLLLRGEDDTRILREANLKLEDESKGLRSRIRKLEDLLHRQSHINRLSLTNGGSQASGFPEPVTPVDASDRPLPITSPRPHGELSRRSSISSRRFSANQGGEEKALTRRILQLEAELAAEKDARQTLAREMMAQKDTREAQQKEVDEANSTKRDIMENMDALQREFTEERKSLEEEIGRYKNKVEELEDEIDRLLGSRDNEQTTTNTKMQGLAQELEQARKNATEDVRKAEQHARRLEASLKSRDEGDAYRKTALQSLYSLLSGDESVPDDLGELFAGLDVLAERSGNHIKDLTQALSMAQSGNASLESKLQSHTAELAALTGKLREHESEVTRLKEELDASEAKAESVSVELEEEREHLKGLRAKFAEGETGSEALRKRVADEEAKISKLSSKLAETNSHVNSLDVELFSLQSKYRQLQDVSEAQKARLQQRLQRAKILTQTLYGHNDRLNRLLETLGFVISYTDNNMIVQRASRSGASTMLPTDGSIAQSRSLMGPPPSRSIPDLSDLSSLLWMEKDSPADEETKFTEYMGLVTRFNLDTVADAITKRMRDMEHTARKWQKEARGYRDKAIRMQSEAHEKLAYRAFKEGDLALFLPTRNQATRPWAAFNVGAPHYFLRETEAHRLANKEWIVARISRVEERIVDLSKAVHAARAGDEAEQDDDDNPFHLSDGLRWYLLDAAEEKPGAPSTPGLGKSTVAAANVDARGSIRVSKKKPGEATEEVSRTLSKSLDSRRSSTTSKKSGQVGLGLALGREAEGGARTPESTRPARPSHLRTESLSSVRGESGETPVQDEVRGELLWSPIFGQNSSLVHVTASPAGHLTSPLGATSALQRVTSFVNNPDAGPSGSGSGLLSPAKAKPKRGTGIWDSLWQLDVSFESGRKK